MAYVDTLTIQVQSGNGGNGKISFRREKYVAKGGPDGGDGGDGGNVIFQTSKKVSTFLDLSGNKLYKARHGDDGRPRNQTGKKGDHCVITVPCGTSIFDAETNELIIDLTEDNEDYTIAKGGKGGKGNPHFSTSRIQTPRRSTPGKPGEKKSLKLELKVIADVGLVGFPNAGKSTLLKTLTQANPKIANYPFTTLHPNLGIFRRYEKEVVIADIPGIIEGASEGIGLGNEFLRHISRTNVLLFLIEPNIENYETTIDTYHHLKNEINNYSESILKEKTSMIALNKIDLLSQDDISAIIKPFKEIGINIIQISCFSRKGIEELEQRVIEHVS